MQNTIKAMHLYETALKIKETPKFSTLPAEDQEKINLAISEGKRLLRPKPK